MFNSSFWRNQPSLTHPELDDDYLFAHDEERHHSTSYQHEDDYEDEEMVNDEYDPDFPYWLADDYDPTTDPLRIVHMAERKARMTA